MSFVYYRVTPLEPLVARDSRPIGNNAGRARSLDWLTPSVLAGAVRSALWRFGICSDPEKLKQVKVSGGFLIANGELCFPRPQDALIGKPDGVHQKCFQVRPKYHADRGIYVPSHSNNDEKAESSLALATRWEDFRFCSADLGKESENFKPDKVAPLWPASVMQLWLSETADLKSFCTKLKNCGQSGVPKDERVHVKIDADTGTAQKGVLFSSVGLDYVRKFKLNMGAASGEEDEDDKRQPVFFDAGQLSVRVDFGELGSDSLPERFIAPVGGDRHLAEFVLRNGLKDIDSDESLWLFPKGISQSVNLRMILAAPALFKNGWLPDWIDSETGKGSLPGIGVEVQLVSAMVGRWKPISGWSYEDNRAKPLRRMVPEGSVYFFKAQRALDENEMKALWLNSVCNTDQDKVKQERNDGFGLALWGLWNDSEQKN